MFCLLLAGDIHQCPGPLCSLKHETESPKIVKSTTASDYPALQVHADFINIANIDSDYPPKFTVCSSSALESLWATAAMGSRPEGLFDEAFTTMGSGKERPTLGLWLTTLTPGDKQRQLHLTANSQDSYGKINTIAAQSLNITQPVDLELTSSIPPEQQQNST